MRLTQLRIKNFRSLVDVTIPLADTTVLLGENNVGKTAVLDAVRHVLSRVSNRNTSTLEDYDVHVASEQANPRKGDGITIEARFEEREPGEWHDDVRAVLRDITQVDPYAVHLRLSARFDQTSRGFSSDREFLEHSGEPFHPRGGTLTHLNALLRYVPLFRLSALRDPGDELSTRSQFWRPILKSLELPEDQVESIQARMNELNEQLLKLDPRLDEVVKTLEHAGDVVSTGTGDRVMVRALPHKAWDLMARSDIVVRGKGSNVAFPLARHGQGLQSLAVLFLFAAFIDLLLAVSYDEASTPILTLEEPEAHLHPQAARALWKQMDRLPGQKIISTHSPYFAQLVPIHDIRILRRDGATTTIHWLPKLASVRVPSTPELEALITENPDLFEYRHKDETLFAKRPLEDGEWKKLLRACTDRSVHPQLRELKDNAAVLLVEKDLHDIEQYVRRSRGEILFARCWLLCEGQSEVMLLPRFADIMGLSLDAMGIAVIDYQNNGSPGAFAALARALSIPWFMVCDGDPGGHAHIEQISNRGFSQDEQTKRTQMLDQVDLEGYLARHFAAELREIAEKHLKATFARGTEDPEFVENELAPHLRKHKTAWSMRLAQALEGKGMSRDRIPEAFRVILDRCKEAADA